MDVLKEAIKHYGKEEQITVAIEELSELAKELCKAKRGIGHPPTISSVFLSKFNVGCFFFKHR